MKKLLMLFFLCCAPMLRSQEKIPITIESVEKEIDAFISKEIKTYKVEKDKSGNFIGFTDEDLKRFDALSIDSKIAYFVNNLRSNLEQFTKTPFFKAYKNEMFYEIQKKAYLLFLGYKIALFNLVCLFFIQFFMNYLSFTVHVVCC